MYGTAGGKPQTWYSQQQAVVQIQHNSRSKTWGYLAPSFQADLGFKVVHIIQLSGIIGCFILSTTMAVMIPRLVLRYHNSLVSRSVTLGTKSIYWGTAAVCWLLSIAIITLFKPLCISIITFLSIEQQYPTNISYISSIVFYVVIPIEFLIISLIAVISNRLTAVPIPTARFTSNVLFCCCCCLCCCSSQGRARGVQAMVLWGFMTFLYFMIMETVALLTIFFVTVPLTLSFFLVHISGLFFVIMLASYIFLLCHSRKRSHPLVTLIFTGGLDICALMLITCLALLFPITFVLIASENSVTGLGAVSLKFSVLPSVGMSVAGWLIRKNLLKEGTTSTSGADPSIYK